MKLCGACHKELPRESFSKKQWQLKQIRRCKECIDANREVQEAPPQEAPPPPPPKNNNTKCAYKTRMKDRAYKTAMKDLPEGASCWICLEDGPDETGAPLVRDCACRGDAGFAHLSCIVQYAQSTSNKNAGKDIDKFFKPWEECPNCNQNYMGGVAIILAEKCVEFVERKFPRTILLHVKALDIKLTAVASCMDTDQNQKDEAIQIGNEILSMINLLKRNYSSMPIQIRMTEGHVHDCFAAFASSEETEAGYQRALGHHEKSRDIYKALGLKSRVNLVESCIAYMKSNLEGNAGSECDDLKRFEAAHTKTVKTIGEDDQRSIVTAMALACALKETKQGVRAERLLMKYASISRRVCGPDHQMTQDCESTLKDAKVRMVTFAVQDDDDIKIRHFQVLRYEEGMKRLAVKGPIDFDDPRSPEGEESFTVDLYAVQLALGTPVVCYGLEESDSYLNGKIGDVRSYDEEEDYYEVCFEDSDLEPAFLCPENLHILFELPSVKQ